MPGGLERLEGSFGCFRSGPGSLRKALLSVGREEVVPTHLFAFFPLPPKIASQSFNP
jgi:hypothetical protein